MAAAFASVFVVSFAVFWVIKTTHGLRVAPEEERYGLDIVEHGMWGYPERVHAGPGLRVPPAGDADGLATAAAGAGHAVSHRTIQEG